MIKIFDWEEMSTYLENQGLDILYADSQIVPETKTIVYISNSILHCTQVYTDKERNRYIFEDSYKKLINELRKSEYTTLIDNIKNTVQSYNLYE